MVRQDVQRIKQVLANILSNAVKYSVKGVIKIDVKSMQTVECGLRFCIKIRDQGVGIKDISNLGQMFKQLDVKDNVNQNGIGFGLTISKMIIEKLGGCIKIKNNSCKTLNPDRSTNTATFKKEPAAGLTVEI
jgi:signal transduction histidine kinase